MVDAWRKWAWKVRHSWRPNFFTIHDVHRDALLRGGPSASYGSFHNLMSAAQANNITFFVPARLVQRRSHVCFYSTTPCTRALVDLTRLYNLCLPTRSLVYHGNRPNTIENQHLLSRPCRTVLVSLSPLSDPLHYDGRALLFECSLLSVPHFSPSA